MGGAESIRGFLCQSLVAIFDSLEDHDWDTVTIEPNDESEKVDIRWTYKEKPSRLLQVKSSVNQFQARQVKNWAEELSRATKSDNSKAELQLVGTAPTSVIKQGSWKGVAILQPVTNNMKTLIKACAQQVDHFCSAHGLRQRGPHEREIIVSVLISEVLLASSKQITVKRVELVERIQNCISNFRETTGNSIAHTLSMRSRNPYFTGREGFLRLLQESFKERDSAITLAVVGLGGLGKTQVAVEYLHRFGATYQHALWIDASTAESTNISLAAWAIATGIAVSQNQDSQTQVRQAATIARGWLTSHSNWLAIVDNVEILNELDFLLQRSSGHVLITSRLQDLQCLAATPVQLDALTRAESLAFMSKRVLAPLLKGAESDLNNLCEELGDLPLALEQAAAYLVAKKSVVSHYLAAFRERRLALLEKAKPVHGHYGQTVATTWSLNVGAVREISQASYDTLVYCAFLEPQAIPMDFFAQGAMHLGSCIASALSGFFLNEERTQFDFTVLDELFEPLVNFSLVEKDVQSHVVSIHRLVQEYTRSNLSERAHEYRLNAIVAMEQTFPPVRPETWPICERYLSNAISLLAHTIESELQTKEASTILHRVGHVLETIGEYDRALHYYNMAYVCQAKLLGELDAATGTTLNNIGVVYSRLGRYDLAEPILRKSLVIRSSASNSDVMDVAQSTQNVAYALEHLGRLDEAAALFNKAIDLYTQEGEDGLPGLANCKSNYARILEDRGDLSGSQRLIDEAFAIVSESPFRIFDPLYSTLLQSRAVRYRDSGEFDLAIESLGNALASIEISFGNTHPKYVESMLVLASIYREKGQPDKASKIYDQALEVTRYVLGNSHPLYAHCLAGRAHNRDCTIAGERDLARAELERALQILEQSKSEESSTYASVQNNLAYLLMQNKEHAAARKHYLRTLRLRLNRNGPNHEDVAIAKSNLAIIECETGNIAFATQYSVEAIRILVLLGIPQSRDSRLILEHALSCFGQSRDMLTVRLLSSVLDMHFPERIPSDE